MIRVLLSGIILISSIVFVLVGMAFPQVMRNTLGIKLDDLTYATDKATEPQYLVPTTEHLLKYFLDNSDGDYQFISDADRTRVALLHQEDIILETEEEAVLHSFKSWQLGARVEDGWQILVPTMDCSYIQVITEYSGERRFDADTDISFMGCSDRLYSNNIEKIDPYANRIIE